MKKPKTSLSALLTRSMISRSRSASWTIQATASSKVFLNSYSTMPKAWVLLWQECQIEVVRVPSRLNSRGNVSSLLSRCGNNVMATTCFRSRVNRLDGAKTLKRVMLASFSSSSTLTRNEWFRSINFAFLSFTRKIVLNKRRRMKWWESYPRCFSYLTWRCLMKTCLPFSSRATNRIKLYRQTCH